MPKATVGAGGGGGKNLFLSSRPAVVKTIREMTRIIPHLRINLVVEVTLAKVAIT